MSEVEAGAGVSTVDEEVDSELLAVEVLEDVEVEAFNLFNSS